MLLQAISTTPFTGSFDGNGYVISNLAVNSATQDVGLIGYLDIGGALAKIELTNAIVTSSNSYVGELVGRSYYKITNCYSTGGQ